MPSTVAPQQPPSTAPPLRNKQPTTRWGQRHCKQWVMTTLAVKRCTDPPTAFQNSTSSLELVPPLVPDCDAADTNKSPPTDILSAQICAAFVYTCQQQHVLGSTQHSHQSRHTCCGWIWWTEQV
jgi:hypothetical protein